MFPSTFKVSAVLFAGCCLHAARAGAGDWPMWRGPAGTGVAREQRLPTSWSAGNHVRWKIPLEGAGVSTPVVWGDRIFLTASSGRRNEQLHTYCVHRTDGQTLWHTRLFGSAEPDGQFPSGGMAVPTPATDGRYLYALFGTGDLVCLDFDLKPVWMRSLAQEYGPFRNRWGMAASPLLLADLLVVLVDHWGQSYLLGIDARTGVNRWKTDRNASVNWSSPVAAVVNGRKQIIVAGTQHAKGYNPTDGTELWSVGGLGSECIPSPVVLSDKVYVASGPKGQALSIRLDGRGGDLTQTNVVWKARRGAPNVPSPLCFGGQYYQVNDEGIATCLDSVTGREHWRERLGGRYQASPVAGDGKLYFTSVEGVTTVVAAGPKFQLLSKNELGEPIVASPAISNGQLFFRGEKHLFCVANARD